MTKTAGSCAGANRRVRGLVLGLLLASMAPCAFAGAQLYEPLSASVKAALSKAIADKAAPNGGFSSDWEAKWWLDRMSPRLADKMAGETQRNEFLSTVHYEAVRAGLDPQLVLGLIQVESNFTKYAVSTAGAVGYMQVMPFWKKLIGSSGQDLFNLRTNLRYGCTILRYYLKLENGNLYRALGRYNGSLGEPDYPNMVVSAWKNHWSLGRNLSALSGHG